MKNFTRYRIIELLELLCGSVLPIIFWLSLIFGFDTPYIAILTVICALCHELGHCIAISIASDRKSSLRGHASGFRIKRCERLSYGKEIFILLAGPGVNILVYIITLPFRGAFDGYIRIFGTLNLVTGISNLLPVEGYDGYGALNELFAYTGRISMQKALDLFSFVFSVCVTFVSLYLIERFSEGYWIFGLFFFMTVSKLVNLGKYDFFGE